MCWKSTCFGEDTLDSSHPPFDPRTCINIICTKWPYVTETNVVQMQWSWYTLNDNAISDLFT